MMTYKIPRSENNWCGPIALAYVMRTHPDEVVRLLQSVMRPDDYAIRLRATKGVVGVSSAVMLKALTKAKMSALPVMPECTGRLSLKKWLELVTREERPYLVSVRQHVLVVHGDRYFDPAAREGNPLSTCPYLNSEVRMPLLSAKAR